MIFSKHINKYYLKFFVFFLIGILALVMVDVVQTFIPRYLGQIIDDNNNLIADGDKIREIIIAVLICAGLMFVGRVTWRLTIFRASSGIEAGLRKEMFEKSERLSTNFYHEKSVGSVMSHFTTDIETIGEFYGWGTIMLVDAFFLSIITIIQMARVSVMMTLIAIIPILLIVVWGALVEIFMAKKWEYRQKAFDELYDFTQENFTGIRVIKAFVKENKEIHHFAKIARKNKDVNVNFAKISVLFDVLIGTIIAIEMAFILGFGGYFVYAAATLTPVEIFGQQINISIGNLVEFIAYVDILIWPMIALGQIVTMRSRTKTSLKRVGEFLDAPEEIQNPENPIILKDVKGKISFNHFSFKYNGSDVDALHDISLTINPGERIGIVGKIGCGKTTFINVLLRLYNIDENSILIDDNDLMKCDIDSLRNNIGYAPQDNFLFSDKIENNIAFSSDDKDLNKVVSAAKFADVDGNIKDFPFKYETVSGERGVTLSGGQKQRISIARAFYKNAPILLLDDTVSAVDVKTEENILHNIDEYRKDRTTIVAASRISTVMHLDRIIVLNEGRLEAFDTHDNLLKSSPTYKKMVFLQKLEEEVNGGEANE